MINENTIKEISKIKGETRGTVFYTDARYVLNKKGEAGLKELRKKLKEYLDEDIYDKGIKSTGWYPLWWRVLSLLLIKDVFNWGEEEIFEMGFSAPKHSFIVKTVLRYFISIEKTFQESRKYWEKHYSVGRLETPEINVEKKHLTIHLIDFKVHPILCIYLKGYFKAIAVLVVKSEKMRIKETKCVFDNDYSDKENYHEFIINWE